MVRVREEYLKACVLSLQLLGMVRQATAMIDLHLFFCAYGNCVDGAIWVLRRDALWVVAYGRVRGFREVRLVWVSRLDLRSF